MVLNEIVQTCSNVHVAYAALASIGGVFASRFTAHAFRCNLSPRNARVPSMQPVSGGFFGAIPR
jgi:hypothetical protein